MNNMYSYIRQFLCIFLLASCSVELQQEETISTTPVELTYCETVEVEYVNYSNALLDSSFELNQYIDNLSEESMDADREKFFDEIDINYKYKEEYLRYLENRIEYLNNIYELITSNLECNFPNDQSITIEQVKKAEADLNDFLNK